MSTITAARFTALKAAIKKECQRRAYTGSVSGYGGTSYDYTNAPAANSVVSAEHYSKNLVPMNAINKNTFPIPDTYNRIVSESEIALMESKVASWASRTKGSSSDNSASDCSASCTGLCRSCTGNCVSGCSGCSGSCAGSCSGCSGSCLGTCNSCAYYGG